MDPAKTSDRQATLAHPFRPVHPYLNSQEKLTCLNFIVI